MQFENPLPLGVADGKLLDVPLDPRDWLVEYRTTALEAKFRFDIYPTSSVLSLPLAFVDPQSYTRAPAPAASTTPPGVPGSPDADADTAGAEGAETSPARRARDEGRSGSSGSGARAAKRRHGADGDAESDELAAELASAESVADAIEEGFAAAAREDVVREPKLLQHPQRAGVYALDVTPLVPCAAVAGLHVCALHFEADPLDNVGASLAEDLGRRRRALASTALVARVGDGGQTLALVAAEPPRAPVAAADGTRLLPYGTVRLFKQKKSAAAAAACGDRATATERSVALLTRRDPHTGLFALEYFDLGDIVTLTRVTDRALVRSVLGDHSQGFYVREQPVPQALADEHDEALAALYATAEQ